MNGMRVEAQNPGPMELMVLLYAPGALLRE